MRCDRGETASADRRHARALELDPTGRLRVTGLCHDLLLAGADLERQRALPRLGKDLVRLEAVADLAREPEPVEPAGREHDGVQSALRPLAEPRADVSTQRLDREGRLEREELRPAPDRR